MSYLVAKLSIPASDEDKLKDAFQNALQWEYSKYSHPIHALFLAQPKLAIIYAQTELVEELLNRNPEDLFQLGGPMSTTFIDANSYPSTCVEIEFGSTNQQDQQNALISTLRENMPFSSFGSFLKENLVTLRFSTSEEISDCLKFLSSYQANSISSRIISVNEHITLRCSWKGQVSLQSTIKRLKSTGQNITSLVQSCLSYRAEQPLILSVQPSTDTEEFDENDATIICATAKDAALLLTNPTIDLLGGSSLTIRRDSTMVIATGSVYLSEHSSDNREVHIFWDFDNCPLFKEDETKLVTDNISSLIKYYIGLDSNSTLSNLNKLLFLAQESEITNRPTPQQFHDLNEEQFKTIYYQKKGGAEMAMRQEVDVLVKRFKDVNYGLKPCVCVITGDRDLNPTLANLHLEGFSDVLLIHSRITKSSVSSLASKTFPWSTVRKFHTLSPNQRIEIAMKQGINNEPSPNSSERNSMEKDDSGYTSKQGGETKKSKASNLTAGTSSIGSNPIKPKLGEKSKVEGIQENVEIIIEIQWLAVAAHFRNLMLWAENKKLDADNKKSLLSDRSRTASSTLTTKKYLIGEIEENVKEEESQCCVTLSIDPKEKKYRLKIIGPSAELADQRHKKLMKMVSAANKDRKTQDLVGWDLTHRECIMGSSILMQHERESESTALFHYNDGTVVAEIVSLTARHHRQLQRYIESLVPQEAQWLIPREIISSYDEKKWYDLQFNYAVVIDKDAATKNLGVKPSTSNISIHVRGFNGLIEKALSAILETNPVATTSNLAVSSINQSAFSILNAPFSSQGQGDKSSTSSPVEDRTKLKSSSSTGGKVSGQYTFQDREVGLFYQSFETEFRQFLVYEFNVDVAESLPPVDKAVLTTQRPQQASLKVSFTSSDIKNINACRNYFEQLSTSTIQRNQVFFPRADQSKYKEILNVKAKQDVELLKIREISSIVPTSPGKPDRTNSFDSVVDSSITSRAPPDPMSVTGFISVRIKPPLHSRGIKRMSLPSDVTVTICGPFKTDEQKACFKNTVQGYEDIDCGNYLATVEIPSSSPITRQLTMRNSRDEFVHTHGLMGLRYEEGSRTSGVAGVVKLYAPSQEVLKTVISFMEENGAQNPQFIQVTPREFDSPVSPTEPPHNPSAPTSPQHTLLNQGPPPPEFDMISNLSDEGNHSNRSQVDTTSMASHTPHFSSMFSSFPGPSGLSLSAHDTEGPPPGLFGLGSIGNTAMHTLDREHSWNSNPIQPNSNILINSGPKHDIMMGSSQLGGTKLIDLSQSNSGSYGHSIDNGMSSQNILPSGFSIPSQMTLDFGGLGIDPVNTIPPEKRVIRWPHHSFRFMFLGEPLKQNLVDLLNKMRDKHGLVITYPHRDKSDHSACLLLEGTHATVNAGAEDINKYMRSVYQQMRCLQLVISENDKKELISNDLNRIKDIQGLCGVHLVLDPLPTDMNEASSTYDLRLPYTDHLLFETPVSEAETDNEFRPLRELLSVVVTSKVTGQNVVVSVIDNKSSTGGWNWGVNNVLLMLDPSADVGLNFTEIEQLDKGEVLVNTENSTGKRILRVRPERISFSTRGIERQAEGFVAALSRGLAAADSLNINAIAVVAPTSTQYFTDLSVELIQSLTMEAIVAFIRRAPVRHLNKILCIEMQSQLDEQMSPAQYTEMSLLLPAGGDRMALTLLILLEQANDPQNQAQTSSMVPAPPSIQLRTCNVPLPRNVRADDLLPSLAKNRPKVSLLPHQIPPVGTSPIILRGLTTGLRSALKTIKQLISSYAEVKKANESSRPLSGNMTSLQSMSSGLSQGSLTHQINQQSLPPGMMSSGINLGMNQPSMNLNMNSGLNYGMSGPPGMNSGIGLGSMTGLNQSGMISSMGQSGMMSGMSQVGMSQVGMSQVGMSQLGMSQLGMNQGGMNQGGMNQGMSLFGSSQQQSSLPPPFVPSDSRYMMMDPNLR